jgi:hypothetical protein
MWIHFYSILHAIIGLHIYVLRVHLRHSYRHRIHHNRHSTGYVPFFVNIKGSEIAPWPDSTGDNIAAISAAAITMEGVILGKYERDGMVPPGVRVSSNVQILTIVWETMAPMSAIARRYLW